jgi:predicted kinase
VYPVAAAVWQPVGVLIVMCGLQGTGKSTIAGGLARDLPAPVLPVDSVEVALWAAGIDRDQPTGLAAFVVVGALAGAMLKLGQTVVVDAVNDAEVARQQWRDLAARHEVPLRFVEVVCSDEALHRRRLAERPDNDVAGAAEPTWESVLARRAGFAGWTDDRLVLDSVDPVADNVARTLAYVRAG